MKGTELANLIITLTSAGIKYQATALELQQLALMNDGKVPQVEIDAKLAELDAHKAEWESLLPSGQ